MLTYLQLLRLFLLSSLYGLFLPLFKRVDIPLYRRVVRVISPYGGNFGRLLFTTRFQTNVGHLTGHSRRFLVVTVNIVMFFSRRRGMIGIGFSLPGRLRLRRRVVHSILFNFVILLVTPFVSRILVTTWMILWVPLQSRFITLRVVGKKRRVPRPRRHAGRRSGILLILLSSSLQLYRQRLLHRIVSRIDVALVMFSLLVHVAIMVIHMFTRRGSTTHVFVSGRQGYHVRPLLRVTRTSSVTGNLSTIRSAIHPTRHLGRAIRLRIFIRPGNIRDHNVRTHRRRVSRSRRIRLFVLRTRQCVFMMVLRPFAVDQMIHIRRLIMILGNNVRGVPTTLIRIKNVFQIFLIRGTVHFHFVNSVTMGNDGTRPLN